MKQPETSARQPAAICHRCGGLMRFIGTEPHPVEPGADLHHFGCTGCDFAQVLTVRDDTHTAA